MWSSRRSRVLGVVAGVLAIAAAFMTMGLVRAGAVPTARVPVIELGDGASPIVTPSPIDQTPRPSSAASAGPTPRPTAQPAPPPPAPPLPPPPVQEPAPARTGGPARVVPPAPVPAGPRDDDADDDDVGDDAGDDDDDEGAGGGDD